MSTCWASLSIVSAVLFVSACSSCHREEWPGINATAAPVATQPFPVGSVVPDPGAVTALGVLPGGRSRILLSDERMQAMKALAKSNHPTWGKVVRRCKEGSDASIDSGYEGWDWGEVMLACALLYKTTGNDGNAKTALKYFNALMDDRLKVGDGKGGDEVVRHDSGYPIRTYGFLGAIGYDWLRDAPGMSIELKKKAIGRFVSWTTWFKEKGYHHDLAISNYYAGYFGAIAMAGIAGEGDDPRASELRKRAQEMFHKEIVPEFKKIHGGQWPEGWQYGGLVVDVISIYVDAETRANPAKPLLDEVPWLKEMVSYRNHALLPDAKHVYDNGDWSVKPALATPSEMYGAIVALKSGDPLAKNARGLAKLAKAGKENDVAMAWLEALAEDPSQESIDPRKGETSYFARGTGEVFGRTDWSTNASWVSLQSGPVFSDHQHADQGHFEVVRGADALIVDPGAYAAFSTSSHNTILIDDNGDAMNYPPNQSPIAREAKIARFEDAGPFVYALADFGSAYTPLHYDDDKKKSVNRAERELVFSRTPVGGTAHSARVVIYDRISLTKGAYAVTWAAHSWAEARLQGSAVRISAGKSAATVTTLTPAGQTATLVAEPHSKSTDAWYNNEVADGMKSIRIEVASPKGETERRFLHAITVGAAEDKAVVPTHIDGTGVEGAAIEGEAYVFTTGKPHSEAVAVSYKAPALTIRHLVVGLAPGGKYGISMANDGAADCRVSLAPGGGSSASAAGTIAIDSHGCTLGK
jgi:hypothetical protein